MKRAGNLLRPARLPKPPMMRPARRLGKGRRTALARRHPPGGTSFATLERRKISSLPSRDSESVRLSPRRLPQNVVNERRRMVGRFSNTMQEMETTMTSKKLGVALALLLSATSVAFAQATTKGPEDAAPAPNGSITSPGRCTHGSFICTRPAGLTESKPRRLRLKPARRPARRPSTTCSVQACEMEFQRLGNHPVGGVPGLYGCA